MSLLSLAMGEETALALNVDAGADDGREGAAFPVEDEARESCSKRLRSELTATGASSSGEDGGSSVGSPDDMREGRLGAGGREGQLDRRARR